MATVPQELLELLDDAEKQLADSSDAVVCYIVKEQEAVEAIDESDEAKEFALEQLQESNAAAGIALTELRNHFGI